MQTDFMGYLLQPLTFITSTLSTTLASSVGDINNIRGMFDKVRTFFSGIIEKVFGVFMNLIIQFQKIIIGMNDLMGKTIGILATLMYVLDGSIKTMESTWNGPPGQMIVALGKCFHPDTKIKLQNNTIKYIKDIDLGDILENGSVVESVMRINNKQNPIPLYVIKNEILNENIYVTGSHLVFDISQQKFIKVENYSKAIKSTKKTEWFSCLITNDHHIKIGQEIFWDWDDYLIKYNIK
jgi:hypothetical protein